MLTAAIVGVLACVHFGVPISPPAAAPVNTPDAMAGIDRQIPSSVTTRAEPPLAREAVDLMLEGIDRAMQTKDVDGVLRHLAPNAIITIQMKQGSQQLTTTLTPAEYRKTLTMAFAFPSAGDYARVTTTVTFSPDHRSAKVSYKALQTLRQDRRDLKVEEEGAFVVRMHGAKPMIDLLEQGMPGDST